MNATIRQLLRHGLAMCLGSLVLVSLVIGCSQSPSEEDNQALIQIGANSLHSLTNENFERGWPGRNSGYLGGSGAEWADDMSASADQERFPPWAAEEYDVCVYWERSLSYEAINLRRERGEDRILTFQGTAWGWILVAEEDVHILEQGIQFEDDAPHLFVDAWDG